MQNPTAVATLFTFLSLCSLDEAAAGGVVGALCVPASEAIQSDLYETAGFGVKFKPGKSGRIRLFCPIKAEGELAAWAMFYRDPDGMNTDYRIRAFLSDKKEWNSIERVSVLDTNTRNERGFWKIDAGLHSNNRYDWVEILMERSPGATEEMEFLEIYFVTR